MAAVIDHDGEDGAPLAVRCVGVEKSFPAGETAIHVLRGTDFFARAGEMTFLVGPSGCGKTTLISIIGAILSADAGTIEVLGTDIRRVRGGRLADFRLANLGFIFQQFNLLPALSATENASLPLVAAGRSTRASERAAAELLDRLGLGAHLHKKPAQLSGGQQQRVAIARALVHGPKLVICDEPTASLDAEAGRMAMELLREVASGGDLSLVVVTHDQRIFEFADRMATMDDGHIVSITTGQGHKISSQHVEGK